MLTESMNFSENDDSEHFQSTLFADQPNTDSETFNSESNEM